MCVLFFFFLFCCCWCSVLITCTTVVVMVLVCELKTLHAQTHQRKSKCTWLLWAKVGHVSSLWEVTGVAVDLKRALLRTGYMLLILFILAPPPPAQFPPLSAPTPPHNPTPSTTTSSATIFCNVIIMHFVGLNGKTVILWTWILLAALLFCIFNLSGFFLWLYSFIFLKVRSPCYIAGQYVLTILHLFHH